ncbi:penicillin-binding protein 1A [Fibrella aquatilis]|uniref:Transglycosylase domain-containing protein n=1 Tax=Fibrella aquatilis TaxID=2817059 RepID=A0A939G4A1_9BACT|nr:transglycosylase domain-containing protein [Fibrella aquatilis]MBO0929972.1 transglycosylase domain-containing protein [Fibrella aquatilis]
MIQFAPGRYRLIIKRLWTFFLVSLAALILYVLAVAVNFLWLFGGMPNLKALENPKSQEASTIYFNDGPQMGKFYLENRTPVDITQVSPNVISALLATEDARFMKHSGIDARSIARAVGGLVTFKNTASTGGGSTLTQQTAKNLFDTREEVYEGLLGKVPVVRLVIAKTKEWILAVRLERNYTKQEIIMMYLNTVSFGNNTYGIKTAARTYFNREPWQLTVDESALLVGMLKNPSLFDPRIFETRARERRNVVLGQMKKYNFLTPDQFVLYKIRPVKLDFNVENQNTNKAPYFCAVVKDYLKNWIKQYNKENGKELNLYTSGLKIYSTIDSRMQRDAEEAVMTNMRDQQAKFYQQWRGRNPWVFRNASNVWQEMPNFIENSVKRTTRYKLLKEVYGDDTKAIWRELNKKVKMKVFTYATRRMEKDTMMSTLDSLRYYKRLLHTGFMSMDPTTGYVRAWVGGVNFKHMKFDHVSQGKRQPGSTFKPFVYLTALNNNYFTTCDRITDRPVVFAHGEDGNGGPPWQPKNSTGRYSGASLSLREALGQSINSVSAQLIKKTKARPVLKTAADLGIDTTGFPANPTLCLGTADVSVMDMVAAYCTFANSGHRVEPIMIYRITDKNDNELARFTLNAVQVISSQKAYDMLYLMRGATEEANGTAKRLATQYKLLENGSQIAAKTGTTSSFSDGWFMGITQNLVSGLWVGGDERSIHFKNIEFGQGARLAMPAWGMYMQKVFADKSLTKYKPAPFLKPNGYKVDCGGYYIDSAQRYIPPAIAPKEEEEILN